jgi:hypothetical protein
LHCSKEVRLTTTIIKPAFLIQPEYHHTKSTNPK